MRRTLVNVGKIRVLLNVSCCLFESTHVGPGVKHLLTARGSDDTRTPPAWPPTVDLASLSIDSGGSCKASSFMNASFSSGRASNIGSIILDTGQTAER